MRILNFWHFCLLPWFKMFLDKGLASLREKLYLKLVNAKNRNLVDPDKTLGGVMEMAQSLPGVMQTLAVTVRQFEISSTVCSRFCHACPLQYKNLILQCSRHAGQEFSCAGVKTCGTKDGSVVAWGDADFGGGSSAVRDQLKGAQRILSRVSTAIQESFIAVHTRDRNFLVLV